MADTPHGRFMTSRSASFAVADSKTRRRSSPLRTDPAPRRRRCEKPRMDGHSAGRSPANPPRRPRVHLRATSARGGATAAPPRECGRCPARGARGPRHSGGQVAEHVGDPVRLVRRLGGPGGGEQAQAGQAVGILGRGALGLDGVEVINGDIAIAIQDQHCVGSHHVLVVTERHTQVADHISANEAAGTGGRCRSSATSKGMASKLTRLTGLPR